MDDEPVQSTAAMVATGRQVDQGVDRAVAQERDPKEVVGEGVRVDRDATCLGGSEEVRLERTGIVRQPGPVMSEVTPARGPERVDVGRRCILAAAPHQPFLLLQQRPVQIAVPCHRLGVHTLDRAAGQDVVELVEQHLAPGLVEQVPWVRPPAHARAATGAAPPRAGGGIA